jgi:hypothetical protein
MSPTIPPMYILVNLFTAIGSPCWTRTNISGFKGRGPTRLDERGTLLESFLVPKFTHKPVAWLLH